jgi:cell division septation protein DedD
LRVSAKSAAASAAVGAVQADSLTVPLTPSSGLAESGADSPQPSSRAAPSAEADSAALRLKADAAPTKTAALYLEVASFKDDNWANNAAEKLQQLGYHTVLIHKNVLWMQSYHVQVGPYASQLELAGAQKSLSAQGFKAHPAN